jgi:FkbM family methyltransferase
MRTGERVCLRPPPAGDVATAYELWVMRHYEPPWPIARPRLVVDLGSNVGLSLAYFASRYPKARVIGFEPHPEHARLARRYVCDNVELRTAAAGVRDGTANLRDAGTASAVAPDGSIEVAAVDFFREFGRRHIDLLKIDIEGGEYDLLADPRFAELSVTNLVLEWHATAAEHRGKQWCVDRLRSCGIEVRDATPAQTTMGILWARKSARTVAPKQDRPRVSIVIPAYNCADRIGVPLEALAAQDAPCGSFEVIVVDNASTDDTACAAAGHACTARLRSLGCDVRVVTEPRAGLGFARQRGVSESRAPLVCFIEDDTMPAPDFVRHGLGAFDDASVGLAVSQIHPRYPDLPPPPAVERREHLLGINRLRGDEPTDDGAGATAIPSIGAGLWVRRDAWEAAIANRDLLRDRAGTHLATGGDIEIGYLVGKAGWQRAYWPEARLEHVIPARRFETRYFCRLITAIVRSELSFGKRYDTGGQSRSRAGAVGRLILALLAVPVLLLREDGAREVAFVLADRWARVRGPYEAREGDRA